MPEQNGKVSGGLLSGIVGATVTGAVGSFVAPASAAAAGGVWNVMGACALGSVVAAPVGLLIAVPLLVGFASENPVIKAACGILLVVDFLAATLGYAAIGAACIGVAAHPVFVCSMIGGLALFAIGLLVTALNAATAAIGSSLVGGCSC